MKVVKTMDPDKFQTVCRAGAETFFEMLRIAGYHQLGPEQIVNMSSVVLAAVLKTFELNIDDIRESIGLAQRFWEVTPGEPRAAQFALPPQKEVPVGEN